MMMGNDQPGRILAWLTGILFSAAVLLLLIGQRENLAWAEQAGWVACSLFLFMPGILLLMRPNLALALLNMLWGNVARSQGVEQKTEWQRLSGEEKSYIILAAVVAAAVGAIVLIRMM